MSFISLEDQVELRQNIDCGLGRGGGVVVIYHLPARSMMSSYLYLLSTLILHEEKWAWKSYLGLFRKVRVLHSAKNFMVFTDRLGAVKIRNMKF